MQRRADLTRIAVVAAALAAVVSAAGAVTGIGSAAGIALGAAFALANFYLLRLLVSRLITPAASGKVTVFLLVAKFFLLLALLAAVFYQVPVAPLSFAVGASTLVVAIVVEGTLLGAPIAADDSDAARDSDAAEGR
ncbi:MAG TPA: hypothetical protein VEC57_04435 [Candidatus Limnocylindrales bacterium]|nr:hypothetical protein [Candidatus Limnocylindrales bacterium]